MDTLKVRLKLAKMLPEMISFTQNCVDGYRFYWKHGTGQLITSREWLYVVHECEKKLSQEQYNSFHNNLWSMFVHSKVFANEHERAICSATFDQRAEALLRTLNQWEEE